MANLKDTLVLGKLTVTDSVIADTFKGVLDGTAAKATADADGANIVSTYLKKADEAGLSISTNNGEYNGSSPFIGGISVSGHGISITRKTLADVGLSTVYNYKGTKAWEDLKKITSAKVGDVYSISDKDVNGNTNADWACYQAVTAATGNNYASYWQSLGGKVDLSAYAVLDCQGAGKRQYFNGEQTMTHEQYCPEVYDIAYGVGCSLKNARALNNQAIIGELILPYTTKTSTDANECNVTAGEMGVYLLKDAEGSPAVVSGKIQHKTLIGKFTKGGWVGNATTSSYPLGFNTNGGNITWGTLNGDTTTNTGYQTIARWDSPNGGSVAFADGPMNDTTKKAQTSMQIDGYFYQNEGANLVVDVVNSAQGANGFLPKFVGGNTLAKSNVLDDGSQILATLPFRSNSTITAYQYSQTNKDWAAFIFDKPGGNWTGIGAHAINDVIHFGPCSEAGEWVAPEIYKQIWNFQGSVRTQSGFQFAESPSAWNAKFEYNTSDKCIDVIFN